MYSKRNECVIQLKYSDAISCMKEVNLHYASF